MMHEYIPLLTILGMTAVTYATRLGGLWLMSRVTPSRFTAACLEHLPGAMLIAIVAPLVLDGHTADLTAVAVTVLVMAKTGNLLMTLGAGVGTVWLLRMVL